MSISNNAISSSILQAISQAYQLAQQLQTAQTDLSTGNVLSSDPAAASPALLNQTPDLTGSLNGLFSNSATASSPTTSSLDGVFSDILKNIVQLESVLMNRGIQLDQAAQPLSTDSSTTTTTDPALAALLGQSTANTSGSALLPSTDTATTNNAALAALLGQSGASVNGSATSAGTGTDAAFAMILDTLQGNSLDTAAPGLQNQRRFSNTDLQPFKDALANGQFTQADLSSAIDQALQGMSPDMMTPMLRLTRKLVRQADLDPVDLVNPDTLQSMPQADQNMLADIVAKSGLRDSSGQVRTDLAGMLLSNINNDQQPAMQNFSQRVIQTLYRHGQNNQNDQNDSTGGAGSDQHLNSLMHLMGFDINQNGRLNGGSRFPFSFNG